MKPIKLRNEQLKEAITGYLAALEALVRQRGALKLYDVNQHCEEFYCDLLNEILKHKHTGLKLVPTNTFLHPNCVGIDLMDRKNHVIVQVTSSATNEKVRHTFDEIRKSSKYNGFTLYFVFIAGKSEKINLTKNRSPRSIVCRREHLLYPENLTALLQGSTCKSTGVNYQNVLKILQYYLGDDNHKMSVDTCFNFVYCIAGLVKSVDHVRCMCEEFMQEPGGDGFDDVLIQRINHQVNNHIPKSLPELGPFRQVWARNTQVYGFLLEIRRLVFEIDCAGRDDYKWLNVKEVKKLVDELLSDIYNTIRAMCKETGISEDVAFTELYIKANEI